MNPLSTLFNIALLSASITIALLVIRGLKTGPLIAGAIAAGVALGVLAGLHVVLPGRAAQGLLFRLGSVALVEELAKYVVVAPWRIDSAVGPTASRRTGAIGRGLGFASAEHLLFLMIPVSLFARRLVTAGALHIFTALLYARPRALRRRGYTGPTPVLDAVLIACGTALHLTYNLLLHGIDGLPAF